MATDFQVVGDSAAAPFTLKLHRGDGMALLAMDWKVGTPPRDFVGFAIEYREPGGDRFFPLTNRLSFPRADGSVDPTPRPTTLAPIQKFRWVHFPRNAELDGEFLYRVTPVFMNDDGELTYGTAQEVPIELRRETYPGQLNVTFTRGFVSSQAFVDRFASAAPISTLLPANADTGLSFVPTHPKAEEALRWMGFEARDAIIEVLEQAIGDEAAKVRVVAYDLNEPGVVSRLERLGDRLKLIIDDDGAHDESGSAETQAEKRLAASAGSENVKRQHMGKLQHNKTIVVDGPVAQVVVCGSTNFSWRGFFVQSNNAVVLRGEAVVRAFGAAFEEYWDHDDAAGFGQTEAAELSELGLAGIDARLAFSPHSRDNALLATIADDIGSGTTSSLLYSLAFLYQTPGLVLDSIKKVTADDEIFVYGVSDRAVGGLDVQKPDGNVVPVHPEALTGNVPEPFKSEPIGGGGNRMHHKFAVIDFTEPTARVYLGSYNFSVPADTQNGENLLIIRDRRIAVAYAVEALRIFDHHHFRVAQQESTTAGKPLVLSRPPREPNDLPWWDEYYTNPQKVRDREMFA
jgi:hypothetical protein